MKRLNYLLSITVTGTILIAGLTPTSKAESVLETGTLNRPDDLTVDPNTGLEFLDITETAGQSVNQVLSSSLVTDQGFRFGTFDEFEQLLVDADFTDFSGDFNTADEPAAEDLLGNFLGQTVGPNADFELGNTGVNISNGFYAFVDDAPFVDPGNVGVTGVDYQNADIQSVSQDQARVTLQFNQFPPDFSSPIAGTLLVRESATAVPTPSAALAGLSMLTLLIVRRREAGQRDSQEK